MVGGEFDFENRDPFANEKLVLRLVASFPATGLEKACLYVEPTRRQPAYLSIGLAEDHPDVWDFMVEAACVDSLCRQGLLRREHVCGRPGVHVLSLTSAGEKRIKEWARNDVHHALGVVQKEIARPVVHSRGLGWLSHWTFGWVCGQILSNPLGQLVMVTSRGDCWPVEQHGPIYLRCILDTTRCPG